MSLIETVDRRAKGLRPRSARREQTTSFVAQVDWLLLGAVVALVFYGLWAIGGITLHDPGGSAASRQAAYAVVAECLAFGIPPIALVFLQPDIGTALVYGAAVAAIVFVAGTRWLHLGILALVAVIGITAVLWILPAAGMPVLKGYQAKRITGF